MDAQSTQQSSIDALYWKSFPRLIRPRCAIGPEAIYNPGREGYVLPVYNLRLSDSPGLRKILRLEPNDQGVEEDLSPFFISWSFVYLIEAKEINLPTPGSARRI